MTKLKMTRQEIDRVTKVTEDAYSFDRYKNWHACVLALANLGYDAREAEAILRSKRMRWAGDYSTHAYGKVTSSDLIRYIKTQEKEFTAKKVAELVEQTFARGN